MTDGPRSDPPLKVTGPFYVYLPPEPRPADLPEGAAYNQVEIRLGYQEYWYTGSVNVNAWLDARKTNGITSYGTVNAQVAPTGMWQDADVYAQINGWTRSSQDKWHETFYNEAGDADAWIGAGGHLPGSQDWPDYIEVGENKYYRNTILPEKMAAPSITNITNTSVQASWVKPTSVAPIIQYVLRTYPSAQNAIDNVGGVDRYVGMGMNVSIPDLTPGATYAWVVYAYGDGEGYSPQSPSTVKTQTNSVPSKPSTPTLTDATTTTLVVAHTDPSNSGSPITARRLQISTTSNFATILQTKNSATSPQTFSGLSRYKTYYIRNSVQNSAGWSSYSSTLTASTEIEPPAAPTGYSATDIASTTAWTTLPNISDNGGSALTNLSIQHNATATDVGAVSVSVGSYAPAFMEGLPVGADRWFRMRVGNSSAIPTGGWGPYGGWTKFTTKSNVPTPPLNLVMSAVAETQATATWTAPTNLQGSTLQSYVLRIATDKAMTDIEQEHSLGPTVLTKTLEGLNPGSTHWAQVHTTTNNGVGSASTRVSFTTTGTAPGTGGASEWKKINGVWKHGTPWKKINGTWKSGKRWKRINGVWKSGI